LLSAMPPRRARAPGPAPAPAPSVPDEVPAYGDPGPGKTDQKLEAEERDILLVAKAIAAHTVHGGALQSFPAIFNRLGYCGSVPFFEAHPEYDADSLPLVSVDSVVNLRAELLECVPEADRSHADSPPLADDGRAGLKGLVSLVRLYQAVHKRFLAEMVDAAITTLAAPVPRGPPSSAVAAASFSSIAPAASDSVDFSVHSHASHPEVVLNTDGQIHKHVLKALAAQNQGHDLPKAEWPVQKQDSTLQNECQSERQASWISFLEEVGFRSGKKSGKESIEAGGSCRLRHMRTTSRVVVLYPDQPIARLCATVYRLCEKRL